MERRRKPTAGKARGSVNRAGRKSVNSSLHLPHIADLITSGEITVGMLRPIGCVATAADEDCTYAMLVRRKNESLLELLTRLDQAIAKAQEKNIFTDEING